MATISPVVINLEIGCYVTTGIVLLGSLLYMTFSRKHSMSVRVAAIILLEIACQAFQVAAMITSREKHQTSRQIFLTASYSSHWVSIGLFTGEYIKVATQIPLLRENNKFGYFPTLLMLLIVGTLTISIYAGFFINVNSAFLRWIAFLTRNSLALTILTVQLITLRSIRKMICEVPDIELNKKTYYETMFIFLFFAINVPLRSSILLAFGNNGPSLTNSQMKLYETAYSIITIFYAFSYLCYINILQAVWSFKHNLDFDCPILDRTVALPVYIRNRQLIRHK